MTALEPDAVCVPLPGGTGNEQELPKRIVQKTSPPGASRDRTQLVERTIGAALAADTPVQAILQVSAADMFDVASRMKQSLTEAMECCREPEDFQEVRRSLALYLMLNRLCTENLRLEHEIQAEVPTRGTHHKPR